MTETVLSQNGVRIRLTDERWAHITEEHAELAGMRLEILETVSNPSRILEGGAGELLAVRKVDGNRCIVVVYREIEDDGFIITAFLTTKTKSLDWRNELWPR